MRVLVLVPLVPLLMGGASEEPAQWSEIDGATEVLVYGHLEGGQKLIRTIEKIRRTSKTLVAMELASEGGSGQTGLALADYVATKWKLPVIVTTNCSSACALAALAALGRRNLKVSSRAEVGVHQFYFDNGKAAKIWTENAAKVLQSYGAPKALLDRMVSTPPDSMTVIDEAQLTSFGAERVEMSWTWWLGAD